MTVVLQHQFWDLAVTEDRFEVRLSFNNIPERLVIPFSAVRIFQDPTVHFALALRQPENEAGEKSRSDLALLPAPKPEGRSAMPSPADMQDDQEGGMPAVQLEGSDAPGPERKTA